MATIYVRNENGDLVPAISTMKGLQDGCGHLTMEGLLNRTEPNGDIVVNSVTDLPRDFFRNNTGITSFKSESVTKITEYAFQNCVNLVTVDCPNAVTVYGQNYCFQGCEKLKNVNLPKITMVMTRMFDGCVSLERLSVPKTKVIYNNAFEGCTSLKILEFAGGTNNEFRGVMRCTSLKILIIHGGVLTYGGVNHFDETPFAADGSGGLVLCPKDRIETYKITTNWCVLYEQGTCDFLPLEDYTLDGTATGEIDWDKVNALYEEVTE